VTSAGFKPISLKLFQITSNTNKYMVW